MSRCRYRKVTKIDLTPNFGTLERKKNVSDRTARLNF